MLYLIVLYDRSCYELREQRYEQSHRKKVFLYKFFVAVNVYDVAESLKCEERDAYRQLYLRDRYAEMCYGVQRFCEKTEILEHHEHTDIQYHGKHHSGFSCAFFCCEESEAVVEKYRNYHDEYCHRFAESIEYEACGNKQYVSQCIISQQEVKQKYRRQKDEQKRE